MSAEHDSPPSDGGEQYANIFIFDGQDYFHLARDQSSTIKGAYTALLENICFMLEEIYGANDQYCLVIPRGDIPAAYKDCSDLIYFENHDGKDSVAGDDIIERREAASVALSDFLYHLRLTAESLPKADNILIEKQSSTKFSIAAKDTRALAYALAILATQHGFHTGLYPVTRHGWARDQLFAYQPSGFYGPHVIGDIKPFMRAADIDGYHPPRLPYSFKDIIDVLNTGRDPVPPPPFQATPLIEPVPLIQ